MVPIRKTLLRKTLPNTFDFKDLTVWKTKLPDAKFAVLPPSNNRPNPLATQDRLFISVFSPGAICALERESGKLIWRREMPKFANASVYSHETKLLAGTSTTLFALRQDSGDVLWSFCPYGDSGEFIYSSPSIFDNRVYLGDRKGFLHCLDAESGKPIWRRRTNKARNGDVNSTPVVMNGLVIVSTNAENAVAFDALSGRLMWNQKLDGPSVFGPVIHQDSILTVADSLYLLNPRTGKVRRRFAWEKEKVQQVDCSPQSIVLSFQPKLSNLRLPPDKAEAEKMAALQPESMTLTLIGKSGAQRIKKIDAYCPTFRYVPQTRLIYLSHLDGVDVLRPVTGALLWQLKKNEDTQGGIALVDVRESKIYVLTGDGGVYALQHP